MNRDKLLNKVLFIAYAFIITAVVYGTAAKYIFSSGEVLPEEVPEVKIIPAVNEFGFVPDSLDEFQDAVLKNETFSTILAKFKVPQSTINDIAEEAKDVFDVSRIALGARYRAYTLRHNPEQLRYFVYHTDPVNYVVFDISDSLKIYSGEKEVVTKKRTASGVITSSLYEALTGNEIDADIAVRLSNVFAWQIDFYRIQKNDYFKIIYEEKYVDGKLIGSGKILGAQFNHNNEDFFAIRFRQNDVPEFFDENGRSLRKAFLKAPLEFTRISSRYSKKRFHPVQKRYKAHLGTDYAAPTGTPIRTVGDGVILEASYTSGNGNYVKVKHNGTYTTQYLHMSKIAKGMRPGVRVRQGEVIGYVGSTGLATGPHLCYRFWKNGVQVDPFREKMPPSHPVDEKNRADFEKKKLEILTALERIKLDKGPAV